MLSQLCSDVITPPPMKPKIEERLEMMRHKKSENKIVIPVIEDKARIGYKTNCKTSSK